MRLGWVGLFALCPVLAAPDFFASVANSALSMKGGATLASLDSIPIARLEQQVKRIVGADPSLPLNLTSARDLSDPALLRVLLLAVVGNFTTGAAASWGQPCTLVLDPSDGHFESAGLNPTEHMALQVVVVLLMIVQFANWALHAKQQLHEPPGKGPHKHRKNP